jgi:hypothetical protein
MLDGLASLGLNGTIESLKKLIKVGKEFNVRKIQQRLLILIQSILTGSVLLLGAAIAQAGVPGSGSITFGPLPTAAVAVPILGSTMLILLALLLAFTAFISFRKRQNGVIPVIAGALALASLASAGGGVSLMHNAYAGAFVGIEISDPAGETQVINGNDLNIYMNESGVGLSIGPVTLPPLGSCPPNALELLDACVDGSQLADGAECNVDCRLFESSDVRLKADIAQIGITQSGLPWYRFRYINGETVYNGVMAQDVLKHTPAAVRTMTNGYMAVDYAMLGLSMRALN